MTHLIFILLLRVFVSAVMSLPSRCLGPKVRIRLTELLPCNKGGIYIYIYIYIHTHTDRFFLQEDPIYLQSVVIHSANGGKG
jgi:hypothetical protein